MPRLHVKEINVVVLKWLPEGQWPDETWVLASAIFALSLHLASADEHKTDRAFPDGLAKAGGCVLLPALFSCLPRAAGMPRLQQSPTALLKLIGKCSLNRRCPLIAWPRWPGGLAFQGHRGLKHLQRQFWTGYHSQLSAKRADWSTPSVCQWKQPVSKLELELQLEGHTHLEDMEVLTLKDGSQGDTVFVPSPGLTTAHWYFPESSLYTYLKPWFSQRTPPYLLDWRSAGF